MHCAAVEIDLHIPEARSLKASLGKCARFTVLESAAEPFLRGG